MAVPSEKPRRHWLITSPRSASNLLIKIMNLEEQNVLPSNLGGYFFLEATVNRRPIVNKPFDQWTAKEMRSIIETNQQAFDTLREFVDQSEYQGKKVFVKEHAFCVADPMSENRLNFPDSKEPSCMVVARHLSKQTQSQLNKTVLPDEYLKTWMPTFLIRHPAMVFPSLLRQVIKHSPGGVATTSAGEMTMIWQRHLYDFYVQHFASQPDIDTTDGTRWPIVLDADDIMTHPKIVIKYAKLVGMDPQKLKFEWDAPSEEMLKSMDERTRSALSTLNASGGISLDNVAGDVDIARHAVQWRDEFGEEVGKDLEKWVREAMPDFEHMKSQRLRPE